MCLAMPSKIAEIDTRNSVIDVDGVKRKVSLLLSEGPEVGDYLNVHAGFTIHKIDEDTTMESLEILKETLTFVDRKENSHQENHGRR